MSSVSVKTPAILVTAALLGVVSGAVGFGAGWFVKPAEVQTVQVEVPAEVEEVDADALDQAQTKVARLERELSTKEREVAELEAKLKGRGTPSTGQRTGPSLRTQLTQLKAELDETKAALAVAVEEKEVALAQLRETTELLEQTEVKLTKVTVQRDDAREDAMFNRWQDFVHSAQLTICDRGGRKKLGNCRATVAAAIDTDAQSAKFAHCLRSGQAQPAIRERENNATTLPEFSRLLNEEAKQTKGWYVEYCDPTLPENHDLPLATGRLPAGDAASQG